MCSATFPARTRYIRVGCQAFANSWSSHPSVVIGRYRTSSWHCTSLPSNNPSSAW